GDAKRDRSNAVGRARAIRLRGSVSERGEWGMRLQDQRQPAFRKPAFRTGAGSWSETGGAAAAVKYPEASLRPASGAHGYQSRGRQSDHAAPSDFSGH